MEASKEWILTKCRMGIKIYSDFINRKNEENELYFYECLATISEFAPYDMQIHKHDRECYGDYSVTYHEIKMRDNNIGVNDYSTSFVDAYKISTLPKIAYETGNRAFINVIYPKDKVILQWEIEPDTKYETTNKDVIWHSKSIKENQEIKLNKLLVELPISEAKKYHY